MLETYPQLKMTYKQKKKVECHIIINDVYFKTIEDQYGLDEYPFVPFVGVFESECELWDLKLQSLVRCMVDPQMESNKRISQMTDLVESQINSGWIADEESVINPRSLFQSGQGKVIWRDRDAKPGALERIQPAQIPPSMFQLQELYAKSMGEILGVNDAAFGVPESGNETGVMMMLRQGAAITNLQGLFDNLRYSQKQLAKKVLKLIQTWTPEKVEKILGRKPSEQFYSKEFINFDIAVTEGPLTDTQKQTFFRQLVDVYTLSGGPGVSPITPKMLVENAPLQSKGTILKQIEQNEQAQQQAQQQAAQMQMQMQAKQVEAIDATIQNTKASSIEKLAGASERRSRTQSDLALATERISESEQNRAQAALDRAKTMVEISQLSDERIYKVWEFVNMLEKQEIIDREAIAGKVMGQSDLINAQVTQDAFENSGMPNSMPDQSMGQPNAL